MDKHVSSRGEGDCKEGEHNLQENGKSKVLVNKCLPCHAETKVHVQALEQAGLAKLLPVHYIYLIFFVVISADSSILGQAPYLNYFRQLRVVVVVKS